MKAIITGAVLLVLLTLLNPGIDQHREAVGEFFEKRWIVDCAENYDKQSWFTKAALFFEFGGPQHSVSDYDIMSLSQPTSEV